MAQLLPANINEKIQRFSELPGLRQVGLIAGLAATIALGVAVMLWSRSPDQRMLYGSLSEQDAAEVVKALEGYGIDYELNGLGTIMVPADQVYAARLRLAGDGIPRTDGIGYELLDSETGLSMSQLMETTRYKRALEGELARTIATLEAVRSARVHLALPKRSVFIRDRIQPTASVALELYLGRPLGHEQAAGIAHLVAAAVPELTMDNVKIVDQAGRLISEFEPSEMDRGDEQFKYTRRLEQSLQQRVHDILMPIVGADGVRAQVTAELGFDLIERSSEIYDPERIALRSEQTLQEQDSDSAPQGIPGALTNQPPPAGQPAAQPGGGTFGGMQRNVLKQEATRNYEVDRTISHIKQSIGQVKRISVAVVVDHRARLNEAGEVENVARDADEMERITGLVKEAVGFDAARGDRVQVVNASFEGLEKQVALGVLPFWQQPWAIELMKQAGAFLIILSLILFVLRPMMRNLSAPEEPEPEVGAEEHAALPPGEMAEDQLTLSGATGGEGEGESELEVAGAAGHSREHWKRLELVQQMIKEDPRRVAQVMKVWLSSENG